MARVPLSVRSSRLEIARLLVRLRADDRQARGHEPPAAHFVDDIDTIVLPVRTGDTEKEGEPAPEAELPLLRHRSLKDENAPFTLVVAPLLLGHAVHEYLERLSDVGGKMDSGFDGHCAGFIRGGR